MAPEQSEPWTIFYLCSILSEEGMKVLIRICANNPAAEYDAAPVLPPALHLLLSAQALPEMIGERLKSS